MGQSLSRCWPCCCSRASFPGPSFSANPALFAAPGRKAGGSARFRKANRLQEIATVSEQFKPSPLVNVFDEVYETYRRQTGGYGPPQNIDTLERAAQTAASESLTVMERRLTWLATIGAISPLSASSAP